MDFFNNVENNTSHKIGCVYSFNNIKLIRVMQLDFAKEYQSMFYFINLLNELEVGVEFSPETPRAVITIGGPSNEEEVIKGIAEKYELFETRRQE